MLTDFFETGLLDRGELGELVGRQLLLDAYHRAVEFEQNTTTPSNFSSGCCLIKMLYTEEVAKQIYICKPDNTEGKPLKDVFKDARICFTHYGKMADDTGTTTAAAWAAFIRHTGMAIMCRNDQQTVDCILPVLLCQWDTNICEHVMTGLIFSLSGGNNVVLSLQMALTKMLSNSSRKHTRNVHMGPNPNRIPTGRTSP